MRPREVRPRKCRPNHRLVKSHRSYTVEEIARLFAIHKNTVRGWLKTGLRTIDDKRPMLILGNDLIAFLQARRAGKKQRCRPGQMYCVRCRLPKFPAAGMADSTCYREDRKPGRDLPGLRLLHAPLRQYGKA
jgi:hypothetical protein